MATRIILDPKKQMLRISCGQCGDTKDIIIDQGPTKNLLDIEIFDAEDLSKDDFPGMTIEPVHVIV